METKTTPFDRMQLLSVIVDNGNGSKVLSIAKQCGVRGGAIYLGRGTMYSRLLDFLDLNDVRKEIVIMLTDEDTADKAVKRMTEELQLLKPRKGIAYRSRVTGIFGMHINFSLPADANRHGGEHIPMHNAIYTIVDKGRAEDVIDAAQKAGSRGGTIIHARGAGVHETKKVFSIEIEPEKEIVLVLAENSVTQPIVDSIRKDLDMEKPGNGIIFVQPLTDTVGLF